MKLKTNPYRFAALTAALFSLLFLSGCSQMRADVPVASVQKSFKTSFDKTDLHDVISLAAKEHGWEVVQTPASKTGQTLELKKEFVKYERKIGRAQRWTKVAEEYDVIAIVTFDSTSLSITPSVNSVEKMEKNLQKHLFNEELAKLETTIYNKLVARIL